jgi:sulfide:quinone oxidoreductase
MEAPWTGHTVGRMCSNHLGGEFTSINTLDQQRARLRNHREATMQQRDDSLSRAPRLRTVRRHQPTRVVIAGGGVAAVEAVLALHSLAGRAVEITLVSPTREFLYRPVTVAEPFDRGQARSFSLVEVVANNGGGRIIWDTLARVEPEERIAVTGGGERVAFDALVIACGALAREPLRGALTFRGRDDVSALRELLAELDSGSARSVAFALPSERMWPLPLYELALLTAGHVREHGRRAKRLALVTPEDTPLELFGPEAERAIGPLLEARGIELRCSSLPAVVEPRALVLAGGAKVYVDRVVTLPTLEGPRIAGLPHDADGFIPVDLSGRVVGLSDVYAAGDVTSFPLKQGGLTAQQADAVAERIAADAGAAVEPRPFVPVLRGLMLTGGAPLYMRCEPQRLASTTSVAIDRRPGRAASRWASAAAGQALWWPPAKIAGRYLGPYLATARRDPLGCEPLTDRVPVAGRPVSDTEHKDAVQLALLLAECDARWGDYDSALTALDAAEALDGVLPTEYHSKRRRWRAAARSAA